MGIMNDEGRMTNDEGLKAECDRPGRSNVQRFGDPGICSARWVFGYCCDRGRSHSAAMFGFPQSLGVRRSADFSPQQRSSVVLIRYLFARAVLAAD
jgi:hypothetical protein